MASRANASMYVRSIGHRVCGLSSTAYSNQSPYVSVGQKRGQSIAGHNLDHLRLFPLPGGTTTQTHRTQKQPDHQISQVQPVAPLELSVSSKRDLARSELVSSKLHSQHQLDALKQFARMSRKDEHVVEVSAVPGVECKAIQAPKLVRSEFNDLFPNRDLQKGECTIVTMLRKTEHDSAAWTPSMELERDQLTANFVRVASEVCDSLRQMGYWADFIDPSSGRPYLGAFTNSSLFETDPRYRHMGVRVQDLGCCKVIEHAQWGSCAFLTTLFTDAPSQSQAVQQVLQQLTQ